MWNSAEHWSAWFTVLGGQSPTDTRGRSCHCGGRHGAACHVLSCAEAGCVSGKGRGPMQAGTSGKHQMQSRASMAVRGVGRRRTALWPSRAGSFHLTASRTDVLCSHWASVPGVDRACPLTLLLVNATTVPGKQHSRRPVTKAHLRAIAVRRVLTMPSNVPGHNWRCTTFP